MLPMLVGRLPCRYDCSAAPRAGADGCGALMGKLARCVEGHIFDSEVNAACPICGWVVPKVDHAVGGPETVSTEDAGGALNPLIAFGGGAAGAAILVAAVIWIFYPRPHLAPDIPNAAHSDHAGDRAKNATGGKTDPKLANGSQTNPDLKSDPAAPAPADGATPSTHESRQQADISPAVNPVPAPQPMPTPDPPAPAPQQASTSPLAIPADAISTGGSEWGAIAISPSTYAWGDSYSYRTRAQAERRAMSECTSNASDCVIASTFYRQCAAVATRDGGNWASGLGSSVEQSARDALGACGRGGHSDCQILAVTCTQ